MRAAAAGAAVAVAATAAILFPPAFVSGDMVFALIWGEQLVRGELDGFLPGPTPHPLPIAWGALVAPLGDDAAYRATQIVWGHLALGAVVALAATVAWRIASAPAALVAASVLLLSSQILLMALETGYDLAFAALVLGAVLADLRRGGRSPAGLALLALSGLIRPEGWVLAAAYWLWAAGGWERRRRWATAGLVAAAPALWALLDGLVTGDPLWSINVTSRGSEALYGQFTPAENLAEGGRDLVRYAGPAGLIAAVAGAVLLGRERPRAAAPVLGPLAVGLAIFAGLTVLGMASNSRYLLLPACLLAVVAGTAASAPAGASRARAGLALAACGLIAVQAAARAPNPGAVAAEMRDWAAWSRDAGELVSRPAVAAALRDCPAVGLPTVRMVPLLAYFSGRAPDRWTSDRTGRTRPDAYVEPASRRVAEAFLTRRRFATDAGYRLPAGLRAAAANRSWRLHLAGGARCARTRG